MSRSKKPLLLAAVLLLSACSGPTLTGGGAALGRGAATPSDRPAAVVTISPASDANAGPATPITVKASDGTLTEVSVTGSDGEKVAGSPSSDGLSWTSTGQLGYGGSYHVVAHATGENGKPVERESRIAMSVPSRCGSSTMDRRSSLHGDWPEPWAVRSVEG